MSTATPIEWDGAGNDPNAESFDDIPDERAPFLSPLAMDVVEAVPESAIITADVIEAACARTKEALGDWRDRLLYCENRRGREIDNVTANAITIFANDNNWRGVLAFDEFAQGTVTRKAPPWAPDDAGATTEPGPWLDADTVRAQAWLRRKYGITIGVEATAAAVMVVAEKSKFHPVREYIEGIKWDGVARVDVWLSTYLGVEDSPYARKVGRWFLTSAVARVYRPGEKVDTLPILEGEQGKGKSTAMSALFHPWFSDTPLDLTSKDRFIALRGVWGFEVAELDSFGRSDAARVKAFVTSPHDDYRPPFGRTTIRVPRRCVFVGTVNPYGQYLTDETGNRRFWPVKTGEVRLEELRRDRDQLWAEAKVWFDAGHKWWPVGDEVELCKEQQAERQTGDAWEGLVAKYLAERLPGVDVTVGDVLGSAIGIEPAKWTRADQMRAGKAVLNCGWQRVRVRIGAERTWVYRSP